MYRFVLPEGLSIKTGLRIREHWVMRDEKEVIWGMLLPDGTLMIEKGYAWDGASPTVKLGGRYIGPPMGQPCYESLTNQHVPQMYIPTLVHDIFCQFKDHRPEGLSLADIDQEFLMQSHQRYFANALLYYRAVRTWGVLKYDYWSRVKATVKRVLEAGQCR